MHLSSRLLFGFAVLAAVALAAPPGVAPPPPRPAHCPVKVGNDKTVTGKPWQIGASGVGGDTISYSETQTIGFTWTVGGNLGIKIDEVFDIGFSVAVARSVTSGSTESVNKVCPKGGWTCSVMIYPSMQETHGYMVNKSGGTCKGKSHGASLGNYVVRVPRKDSAGNGVYTPYICVCKNKKHWADKGAPSLACMSDC